MDFNPTERLQGLLGPSPKDPWPALIPQILLWCFRRFCIQKLIDSEGTLSESLWEDHHQLVQMYCPRGLESTSMDWLTPENMGMMSSSSEDYNRFFIDFLKYFDQSIVDQDYELQDVLSEFLDSQICIIIYEWLDESPFAIFPVDVTQDDSFTDEKFSSLIDAMMSHVEVPKEALEQAVEQAVEQVKDAVKEVVKESEPENMDFLLWRYLCIPPMMPDSLMPHEYVPPEPVIPATVNTVARAMAYRRTIRLNRAHPRVKTRRTHPAL